MTVIIDGTTGITSPAETTVNLSYTGTLTGGTGVVNLGSGQVYKDASGNVGIGTSSPGAKLVVTGSAAGAYGAIIYNTSATGQGLTVRGGSTSSHDAFNVQTYDGGASLLSVQAGGNVGIGTGSPVNKLQVSGAVAATGGAGGYAANMALLDVSGGNAQITAIGANTSTVGTLVFQAFSSNASLGGERARIDSSGNLLVGTTTSPGFGTKNFELNAGAGGGAYIVVTGSSNTVRGELAIDGGAMYIGTKTNHQIIFRTNDATKMTIATSGIIASVPTYNNTTGASANVVVFSDGTLGRSSSALKYKQDIRDLESMDISLLRPVRYKSKCEADDQTKDHLGLIADEAAENGFEELISRGADGEVEGFQYERLTVVLLKTLQEQQTLITALTARITALEQA